MKYWNSWEKIIDIDLFQLNPIKIDIKLNANLNYTSIIHLSQFSQRSSRYY